MERPARSEPAQHIVGARRDRKQFGLRCRFQIRPAKPQGLLETAILVEHDARRDQRGPGQMIGQPVGPAAIFRKFSM
jgi:hypothetical protein